MVLLRLHRTAFGSEQGGSAIGDDHVSGGKTRGRKPTAINGACAGIGLVMTPGTTAITGSLPVEEQGVASALNDVVREVGTTVGVALGAALCLLYFPAAAYGAMGVAVASLVIYAAQVPIIGGRGALARAVAGSRS